MAELLVRTISKTSDNIYDDVKLTKRGDVIVVMEDGHEWSPTELKAPFWQIIKVPGVKSDYFAALLVEELKEGVQPDPAVPNTLQRRAFKLDLDNLPNAEKFAVTQGDERAVAAVVFDHQLIDLHEVKVRKAQIEDPNIFGDNNGVWQPL